MPTIVSDKKEDAVFALVDWQKAADFITLPSAVSTKARHANVHSFLKKLFEVGEKGMMYAFHASDPRVVEYIFGLRNEPPPSRVKQFLHRLEEQHLVKVSEDSKGLVKISITKKGQTRSLSYQLDCMKLKEKMWDKKWRVIIFDIPEKYRDFRNEFRKRLRQLGLFQLQESVYVSPYSCFDEIEFLRELFGVAMSVRYIVAEKIEDDDFLLEHFHLK